MRMRGTQFAAQASYVTCPLLLQHNFDVRWGSVLAVSETQAGVLHIQALSKGNYDWTMGACCTDGMTQL